MIVDGSEKSLKDFLDDLSPVDQDKNKENREIDTGERELDKQN